MRVVSAAPVLALLVAMCVCARAAVQVKDGERSFPLEAVKQLKKLLQLDAYVSPHLSDSSVAAACAHPLLPQAFRPVCQGRGAGLVLSRLVYIITPSDPCEICANPSCFGCLS